MAEGLTYPKAQTQSQPLAILRRRNAQSSPLLKVPSHWGERVLEFPLLGRGFWMFPLLGERVRVRGEAPLHPKLSSDHHVPALLATVAEAFQASAAIPA